MSDTYVGRSEFEALTKRLDTTDSAVATLSDSIHAIQLSSKDEYHGLQDMIRIAVEDGNREMQTSLKEYTEKTSGQLCSIENRVHRLEDADGKKAQKELAQRENDKKENRKHAIKTAIGYVVTFLGALFLNNLFDVFTK